MSTSVRTSSLEPVAPRFTLADVVLSPQTRNQVERVLALRRSEARVFGEWGLGALPHFTRRCAVNLHGPPGTGKTALAHAMAHALGQRIVCTRYSELESRYVGDTPKNLVAAFETARAHAAVLFIDEADGLLGARLTAVHTATDASVNVTRAALLALLNDDEGTTLFATNALGAYDPAFLRRMVAHIEVGLPDEAGRLELLRRLVPPQLPVALALTELAARTAGLSGGDLANVVLNAALAAARSGLDLVPREHFEVAIGEIESTRRHHAARARGDRACACAPS